MAHIDTSNIEGFDAMSAEDKVKALLGVDLPEAFDPAKHIAKSVFDKKASEAAELSKQLKSRMTEDEQAEADKKRLQEENDQKYADLESKYNELMKKNTIAEYKAQYVALGMDAKLAEETAKALADGDTAKVFENQQKHNASLEKKIKEQLMNGTPKPDGTGGGQPENDAAVEKAKELAAARFGGSKTYEDIMKNYRT